jgi:hypothetical protein
MFTGENDPRTAFEKTTAAVNDASEAVERTTENIRASIRDSQRPGGVLDQLTRFTREAPLRSLAIAFVLGMMVARR